VTRPTLSGYEDHLARIAEAMTATAVYLLDAPEDADSGQLDRDAADDLFTEVEAAWNTLFPERPALADLAHSLT
jgi:hypothetical protein